MIKLFALLLFVSARLFAADVRVGLEISPPLVTSDGGGSLIDVLRSFEKVSDLRFRIAIMPYNRALKELKAGRRDLIFPTRFQAEGSDFYVHAEELAWNLPVTLDVYQARPIDNLDILRNKTLRFGTPRGSETPFSKLTGIPLDRLVVGDADNLLQMLKAGRIDAYLGARPPTMASIERLQIPGLWYRTLMMKSGGFGVRKTPAGRKLKEKLDALLSQVAPTYFDEFLAYNKLPEFGPVFLRKPMPDSP